MKRYAALYVVVGIPVLLYLWYQMSTYTGPSGPAKYKDSCGFFDWLFHNCNLPYTTKGGIGVS